VTDLPPGARVVAYLRDSGHSDQERSVTQQRAAVDAYCQAGDLVLVETYADEATPGGTVAGRDAFGRMIDDLRRLAPEPERGERDPAAPDAVLYWDLRRFARDQTDSAFFRADLRRRGYQLLSLADTIPNGDMAPVFEAMLAWKAEEDRRQMSRDIRRGLHDLVSARDEDGEYLNLIGGHPPAGFRAEPYQWGTRRDGSPRFTQRWVPDPDTWERVQQAWRMRAEGASYADIHRATRLFANLPSYSQMFTRTLYRGDLTYGGRVYEGWITPCVDRATWDAVQARRLPPGKHRARLGTTTYTLSGWLRCGACGLAVTGSTNKTVQGGKTYRYRRYRCTALTNRKRFSTCAFATRAEPLERAVYNALATAILTPDHVRTLLADHEHRDAERDRIQATLARIDQHLARHDTAMARLTDAVEQSGGQIARLVERLQARQRQRTRLQAERAQAQHRLEAMAPRELPPEAVDDFCAHIREVLASGEVAAVRDVIGSVVDQIIVWPDRHGTLAYTLPEELGAASGELDFFW